MLAYDVVTFGPLSWESSFKTQDIVRHVGITGELALARAHTWDTSRVRFIGMTVDAVFLDRERFAGVRGQQ